MENSHGERLNAENENARAIERGQEIARGGERDSWDECYWGREMICGFGTCGFVILPIIDCSQGQTPQAPVKELFLMTKFFGSEAEIEGHFERLRALHVGKPCGLLALILDEQEANHNNPKEKAPTPAETESRKAAEDKWLITDPEFQKVTA